MTEQERNQTALMVMIMICVMTGWIPGAWLLFYGLGIYLFIGLAALVLPIVVLIAPDKRALWLLLASFLLALTASLMANYAITKHLATSGTTIDFEWRGAPLFFKAWGAAFVSGLPGVLIGAGVQWLWEEIKWKWRRMK